MELVRYWQHTYVVRLSSAFLLDHFPIRGTSSRYGRGTGEILLDNIICTGDEASLLNCGHNPLMENNCADDHSEDAAVVCGGM